MNAPGSSSGLEIAVVGMALRLPRARDAEEFWAHLLAGRELIRFFDDAELLRQGVPASELSHPGYVKAAGCLDAPFAFDREFFEYTAREAEFMDPQLRLLHECCWEALEAAGCDPALHHQAVGVYVGSSQNFHWLRAVGQHVGDAVSEIYDVKMLYQREFFASRIAYRLDLKGPALTLDTTCSTSLVAVHLAAQGLLSGDCDIALAGGACVSPLVKGYIYHEGMIQSPDGHCRPFDALAKGTTPGQGVGIVALKRLDDAIAAGDPIRAVLRASVINNDGRDKVGYTAPSVSGQSKVIRAALELAQLEPADIDFVECHGTATRVGDPIEIEALARVHAQRAGNRGLLVGSVKSNLGHLDAAAGIAGFIKAVLSVERGVLPPSLYYSAANPLIDFANGRIAVNAAATRIVREGGPVRGGVSSFGIGGTNAHVILEQYVESRHATAASRRCRLVPLSAKTPEALSSYASRLADACQRRQLDLDAIARTLQVRRRHFPIRQCMVADELDSLLAQLRELADRPPSELQQQAPAQIVFMFPGQGAQYAGMTRGLYENDSRYRAIVDECLRQLEPGMRARLQMLLSASASAESDTLMARTDLAQPMLFIVSYALARALIELGVEPAVMIGHSLGEYVAACLAEVFSLEDALRLVCERGRLMAAAPAGAMLSVPLSAADAQRYLDDSIELAADNSTSLVVLAGPLSAIEALQLRLANEGIASTRLKTSHAYHSRMMEPALDQFRSCVAGISLRAPKRAYVSNRTGKLITTQQTTSPDYWCEHLRHHVRFADSIEQLLGAAPRLLVEVGPGNALSTFAQSHARFAQGHRCVQSVRHPKETRADDAVFHQLLASLYVAGTALDWQSIAQEYSGPFVTLPTYAFAPTVYDQIPGGAARQVSVEQAGNERPAPREIRHARPQLSASFAAAASDTEQRLCELWQNLFKLDRVGVDDNFFELGGHSLLATRLVASVREQFAADVPLQALFDHPTIRSLATELAAPAGAKARPPLLPVDRSKPIPASFQQRRLWIIDQLGGGSAQYNMPAPFILHGDLNRAAMQGALDTLLERHESLRTTFSKIDGEPFLNVRPHEPFPLAEIDLSVLPEPERLERRRQLAREDALRAFDLAQDLPLRVTVVKLGAREHLLLFNAHHIVSDGWSEVVLVREFRELYEAFVARRSPRLPQLTLKYADYAAWQRGWLSGEVLEGELSFWRQRLEGIAAVHELPLDRPRPKTPRYNGALIRCKVPSRVLQGVKALAQKQGASSFMALQSAFAVLLARWSNNEDIVMGTPIAGREQPALEPLIGFFVNTLILRTDLQGNPSYLELLARTRQMALSAFEHQHVPFEMLVDALTQGRSPSHAPLFQILFALQNYERSSLSLENLTLQRVEETPAARFDLSLIAAEADDGLLADWYYDADLFDARTIERMAEQYSSLLSALTKQPHTGVFDLQIVAEQERLLLLDRWQRRTVVENDAAQAQDWFVERAAEQPDAPALCDAHSQWSYGEVDARSNRLAHYLIAQGVAPHALVAISAEAGADLIVAILAVLKCGAGYVPLDPSYPRQRLMYMIEDSRASALIVDRQAHRASLEWQGRTICLDAADIRESIERYPARAPTLDDASAGDRPAYVIYTSGSTGRPKGTLIKQRQLVASLVSRFAAFSQPVTCALLTSSISFDSSVPPIFWCLSTGGQLYVCNERERRDPAAVAAAIDRLGVTHYMTLPSFYNALLDSFDGETATGRSLEAVLLAGEALPPEVRDKHFAHPSIRSALYNEYGPTECSVWSTLYRCEPASDARCVPIGSSPGHARLYVLNRRGALAPIGVEGELYIGGDGVAEGYLNQPQLTAQRFLADPFSASAGARMYRSGDRVRWRSDGQLEFLGRIDQQVKLRGYRIELAEVEDAAARYPAVVQAVARVLDQKLVAYVTLAPSQTFEEDRIRDFVAAKLPDYMVPQRVVPMDALPLLPNGKVDVARLPAPTSVLSAAVAKSPRNDHERLLADLWCELLKLDAVSIDHDFFRLGGDSILLLKLSAALSKRNLKFAIREFYARPTIECLAELLAPLRAQASEDAAPSVGDQVLHPAQRWFLEGDRTDRHHFNQALLLRVPSDLSFADTLRMVTALHDRHDVLRLQFKRDENGQWRGTYRPLTKELAAESCLSATIVPRAGESIEDAIEREAQQVQESLSLAGPLLRAAHWVLPDGTSRWLIVLHHLVVDGVSWRILLASLSEMFQQLRAGAPIPTARRTQSYQHAVEALREIATSERVLREIAHWEALLVSELDELGDSARSVGTVADEDRETLLVGHDVTQSVLKECYRAYGMTIEEVLLAALALAACRWQGCRRVPVMIEGHGRSVVPADVSETVGWFTTLYPIVLEAESRDVATHLRRTKDALRRVPARGRHYGLLKYLTPTGLRVDDREFRRRSITFNYLGQFERGGGADGAFALASEPIGRNASARRQRDCTLALDGVIVDGQLRFTIRYDRGQFDRASMRRLASGYARALEELIERWSRADLCTRTASDFELLPISDAQLLEWQVRWPDFEDAYPATPIQHGMIFHTLLDQARGGSRFVNQMLLNLEGPLDLSRLERAWQHVVATHDALKTGFATLADGGLAQVVLSGRSLSAPFFVRDISMHSAEEQARLMAQGAEADRARRFVLDEPPLTRLSLWRLSEGQHRLLWTSHHAIIDGWSIPLVFRSLMDAYRDVATPSRPAPRFKSYVEWLLQRDMTHAREYWRAEWARLEAPCLIRNPTDDAAAGAGTHQLRLDALVFEEIARVARAAGATTYSLLQAAWAYLLHTYTGQRTVAFGSINAGRPPELPDSDRMVGLFINTLPTVVCIDSRQRLDDWLKAIHEGQLRSQAYGHLPWPEISKLSPVAPGEAFNSVLAYQNYPLEAATSAAAELQSLRVTDVHSIESTDTDLALVAMPGKGGLGLKLMYSRQSLSDAFAAHLLEQLVRVLTALPANLEQPVQSLDAAISRQSEGADLQHCTEDELLSLLAELEQRQGTSH